MMDEPERTELPVDGEAPVRLEAPAAPPERDPFWGYLDLLIFAGLRNAAGNYADACIDKAAILDNNWISGGKRGNVALWVPLRSCNP